MTCFTRTCPNFLQDVQTERTFRAPRAWFRRNIEGVPAMSRRIPAAIFLAALTTVLLPGAVLPAHASLVGTDQVLHQARTQDQRKELVRFLQRDDVRDELQALGVEPGHARERVARLTDTEVARLHDRVSSLPAGGAVSNLELILIILLVVLLV